jgi:hypothetical protein
LAAAEAGGVERQSESADNANGPSQADGPFCFIMRRQTVGRISKSVYCVAECKNMDGFGNPSYGRAMTEHGTDLEIRPTWNGAGERRNVQKASVNWPAGPS